MNHLIERTNTLRMLDAHQLTPLVPFVRDCRTHSAMLYLAGNGGSFATALHWACDLSKVCAVHCQVLGANGAALTAWANDESYAEALAAELARCAQPGDCLIALSCSGTSPNICAALSLAQSRRNRTALITGLVNDKTAPADITIRVPSDDYGVIEDCFAAIGHYLTKELAQ